MTRCGEEPDRGEGILADARVPVSIVKWISRSRWRRAVISRAGAVPSRRPRIESFTFAASERLDRDPRRPFPWRRTRHPSIANLPRMSSVTGNTPTRSAGRVRGLGEQSQRCGLCRLSRPNESTRKVYTPQRAAMRNARRVGLDRRAGHRDTKAARVLREGRGVRKPSRSVRDTRGARVASRRFAERACASSAAGRIIVVCARRRTAAPWSHRSRP